MEEQELVKIIEGMGKFMNNTNEMIASLRLRIENQQLDIDKLRKELRNYKNNGKKILV